jgi:hypothetical protein
MELNLRVIYPQFEEGAGVQGKLDGAALIYLSMIYPKEIPRRSM